ncbi:hypothetical protein LCGC14_0950770 [marine sediment metagenome]|uniref:Tyr recombinase domain-containing protein n=1 Tax=marine sediment metagenome TaxID=412755 RepID=A0A0F9NHD1_9ZZZZ|nr:site-specific integrase [Methylophaga sp.]
MNEKTKQDYLKLAQYFLQHRLIDNQIPLTPKNIRQALTACAKEYRPAYWLRLRCALVTQQRETGFSKQAELIKAVRNPITLADASEQTKALKKPKQKRIKTVTKDQHQLIYRTVKQNNDKALLAMIEIARILGCRPIEMLSLQLGRNNEVFIDGAKKTENGLRGLNRTVILTDHQYDIIERCHSVLHEELHTRRLNKSQFIKRLQRRLDTVTKKIWLRRKHRITLYSYRHLMGSDLKASGKSRVEIATIMGHQSVDSIDVYGNKSTSTRRPTLRGSQDSMERVRKTVLKSSDHLKTNQVENT